MKTVFVDLSNNAEIKILNTNIKKSLHIVSAYYIKGHTDKDPIETINNKLVEEKLTKIPIVIIPPRSIMNYHIFYFPPMPDKEVRKILPREIGRYLDSTENIIFDFKIGSTVIDKTEKKKEIITYYIKKKEIWDLLESFKQKGLQVTKIIPEIQSIGAYIKEEVLVSDLESKNGIVSVEMTANKINMNIFNKNIWSLNREFPFKVDSSESIESNDFSRISTEFSRTFQYFKQKNKNVTIDEAIVFGSNPDINILNDFINSNQPINSTLISLIKSKSVIEFPKNLKDKNEFLSIFFISIETANSIIRKDFIDLYPQEFIQKEKFPKQIIFFSIIGIIILITLSILITFYLKQKNTYKADLTKYEKEFKKLQVQINQIERIRKKRKKFYETIILLETPKKTSYQISDFIRNLSLIITKDLQIKIQKLHIIPDDEKLNFIISGKLFSENINKALSIFDTLLKNIKKQDQIKITNFSDPSSVNVVKENNNLSWDFSIQGESELIRE